MVFPTVTTRSASRVTSAARTFLVLHLSCFCLLPCVSSLAPGVVCDRLERGHGGLVEMGHLLRGRLVLDELFVRLLGLRHLVVDHDMPELPCGHPVGEQDVELGEGEPAGLRETE